MIHTIEYPDCPKCGREMAQCTRRLQRKRGEVFGQPLYWWECGWCHIQTPEEEDRESARKGAIRWVKVRYGKYADKNT